jgi:hypothetical protein
MAADYIMANKPSADRQQIEATWDRIAADFPVLPEKEICVNDVVFRVVHAPWTPDREPKVYIKTGLNFLAWARIAGVRYRFVLQPLDTLGGGKRWEIRYGDIVDWIIWANHMFQMVTLSTMKSGAGFPLDVHGQSVPFIRSKTGSALADVGGKVLAQYEEMPRFRELEIRLLDKYPALGIRIIGKDTIESLHQVAEKTYELAVNYDNLKAFNLVILPGHGYRGDVVFFPRRKDGRSIYGEERWQIAGLEFAGLLLCREEEKFARMNAEMVAKVFESVRISRTEMEEVISLLHTF